MWMIREELLDVSIAEDEPAASRTVHPGIILRIVPVAARTVEKRCPAAQSRRTSTGRTPEDKIIEIDLNVEDPMTTSNQTVERCIEECLQCLRWCSQCRNESLTQDPIMMRDCIRLCNECLELCRTCVTLLTGSSQFSYRVCGICAELCTACAADCGKYEGETMRKCAQACRRCAATCAEVAQAGPIRLAAAQG